VWGLITTYRPRGWPGAKLLRFPLLGAVAIPAGIMFYAYIAHRYTSEFVPALVFAAAIGFVAPARRLPGWRWRRRVAAFAGFGVLAVFGLAATMAAALNTHALANPGDGLADYVGTQERISSWMGHPLDGYVTHSEQLTLQARADELRIIGDCQALFVGTGDEFRPWEM